MFSRIFPTLAFPGKQARQAVSADSKGLEQRALCQRHPRPTAGQWLQEVSMPFYR